MYIRAQQVEESNLGQAITISITDKNQFYGMNKVAKDIWELLLNPQSQETIVNSLLEKYNVSNVDCNKQVKEFISELFEAKLIKVVD